MISKNIQKEIKRAQSALSSGEEWEECDCCSCWHPITPHPLKAADLHAADCRNDEQRLPSHPEDYMGSLTIEEEDYARR